MRPLILGKAEYASLLRVKAHAEANPFPLARVIRAFETHERLAQDPAFRCEIPFGFQVAFTIEQHPPGWARHLSVWLLNARPGEMPGSGALQTIGRVLGLRMDPFDPSSESWPDGDPPQGASIIEPIQSSADSPRPAEPC